MKNYNNKRREFIRNLGLGTAATIVTPLLGHASEAESVPDGDIKRAASDNITLKNGLQVEMLTDESGFLGLGGVSLGKQILRNGKYPMFCDIRNPKGIAVTGYKIIDKQISPEGISLKFSGQTYAGGQMEYMLHTVRNRENLYGFVNPPINDGQTIVSLEILPVSRKIGKYNAIGFSYQYKFSSKSFDIYKILDRATWEIGGSAVGNECWMRIGHAPAIRTINSAEDHYTTELYMKGLANPNIFQFLPLQTELQGFTFAANADGILVTYARNVSHVRTLLEKPRGEDQLFHFHQHCNDLSDDFETSPMEVLWIAEKGTSRSEKYNIYETVRDFVSKNLHEQAGLKEERIVTYGEIEEWAEPDFDYYTDHILPQLIKNGAKRVFIPNQFQNAMNTWGLSNMCCNVDYKFSEVAGIDKIKRFCKVANDAGVQVEMWGNTAISTLTEMFMWHDGKKKRIDFLPEKDSIMEVLKTAAEPFVRNLSNAIEADHYNPRFAVLNFRDKDIMGYWMKCWKIARETGISGIFLDSSFNMTSDKFHFIQNTAKNTPVDDNDKHRLERPADEPKSAVLTQYPAHLELMKTMQAMGYSYCGEDLGVFGVHRHGPDVDKIVDSMPLWKNCVIIFDEKLLKNGVTPIEMYFKGLAYQVSWCMQWDFKSSSINAGLSDPKAYAFLTAFNAVNELMKYRDILPGETAVKYLSDDGKSTVYWVFDSITIPLTAKRKIWNVTAGKHISAKELEAKPLNVYVIS